MNLERGTVGRPMISRSHHFWPTDPFRLPCQPAPTARETDEVRGLHRLVDPRCKMAMAMASFAVASHHRGAHLAAGFPSTAREGGRVGRSGVTISMRAQVDAQLC